MKTSTEINEILESKQFCKNGITFQSPKELLTNVINLFNENYKGFATHPVSVGEENEELTAFGRVGLIKEFSIDKEMNYQIGFLYSLEQGKPFIKVFSGFNISICSNMCIFNAKNISKFDIATNGTQGSYDMINTFLNEQSNEMQKGIKLISEMKKSELSRKEVKVFLGELCLNFSATKNIAGTSCILNASKLLTDKQSDYYFENFTNCWNVYNALTDGYRDKTHVIDQPEKVLSIYNEMKKFITTERLMIN